MRRISYPKAPYAAARRHHSTPIIAVPRTIPRSARPLHRSLPRPFVASAISSLCLCAFVVEILSVRRFTLPPRSPSIAPSLRRCSLVLPRTKRTHHTYPLYAPLSRLTGTPPQTMASLSALPALIADESIKNSEDLLALSGAADGVNLKLSKCGGILKTLDLVSLARSLDMTVMIGCMIESSLATTAAAHIAALADFVDLDGITYLAEDPFQGMTYDKGRIGLSEQPGLGVFDVR